MKKTTRAALFAVLAFFAVVSGYQERAFGEEAGTASQKETCVTSKCHATMGSDKFVHAPVAAGDCNSCHTRVGKHKFAPISDIGKLCYQCHEERNMKQVVHKPVGDGRCTACHNPHQSPNKFQLKAAGSQLCFLCHSKTIIGGKYVHGPAGAGSCAACHAAHESDNGHLLLAPGNELCFTCHSDQASAIKSAKFVHTAVLDGCTTCHNPHSADFAFNLSAPANPDLCFTCHADKQTEIKEATVPHKALESKQKCFSCHDPHATPYPKQLVKQPADLCLDCHDREYGAGEHRVADIKSILQNNKDHHGPIRQNDCSGCHNTHGSKNFRMLRAPFPQLFYASYDPDNYKLCFMCHETSLASQESTTTLTNFRNGDRNLHFVHVNKPRGRTCRACHDAHGTNNAKHIRDSVPFGAWPLPVAFSKTENGGSCLPGCHQRYSYDRLNAIQNKRSEK